MAPSPAAPLRPPGPDVDSFDLRGVARPTADESSLPLSPLSLPKQQVTATTESTEANAVNAAACPICCGDLHSNRGELGALTLQGRRMEQSIYHAGCITMMLAHKGSMITQRDSGAAVADCISWGLSPVTRKPVDGFMRMPSLSENAEGWIQFIDWKVDGHVDVGELAIAVAALLPIDVNAAEDFVRNTFLADECGVVSKDTLISSVLPYLLQKCQDKTQRCLPLQCERISSSKQALDSIKQLHPSLEMLHRWRFVSKRHLIRIHLIFARSFCRALNGDRSTVTLAVRALEASVGGLGDALCIDAVAALLESDDDRVRKVAAEVLPSFAARDDCAARRRVAEAAMHRAAHQAPGVRQFAVEILGQIAIVGDQRVIQAISARISDSDANVRREAETTMVLIAKGDEPTILATIKQLENPEAEQREVAIKILAGIVEFGDERAKRALLSMFKDPVCQVRQAAVCQLPRLAPAADPSCVRAIIDMVDNDSDGRVVYWAMKVLMRMAGPQDQKAMKACYKHMGGNSSGTRCQAADSYAHLAQPGDERALNVLLKFSEVEDNQMRQCIVDGLVLLAATPGQRKRAIKRIDEINRLCCGSNPSVARTCQLAKQALVSAQDEADATPQPNASKRSLFCFCSGAQPRSESGSSGAKGKGGHWSNDYRRYGIS